MSRKETEFQKFDAKLIENGDILMFQGPRRCGKTYYILYLLRKLKRFSKILVISETNYLTKSFESYIPSSYIKTSPNLEKLESILELQAQIIDMEGANDSNNMLIIFDDCMGDAIWKSASMQAIFSRGRHWNISLWITMQYVKGILPALRSNVDWVFSLRDLKTKSHKMLYDEYFGHFPKYTQFYKAWIEMTKDRFVMIARQTSSDKIKSDTPLGMVFWDKASDNVLKNNGEMPGSALYQAVHDAQISKTHQAMVLKAKATKKRKRTDPEFDGVEILKVRI